MNHFFPLAFMANTFAMTVLLIAVGLAGDPTTAAEIGIVQGATLALFYAFSANARSLILSKSSSVLAHSIMKGRLLLLIPLAGASYWLSAGIAGVEYSLAIILILRRCVEWLGEVHLSETERLGNQNSALKYLILQSALLVLAIGWLIGDLPFPLLGLFAWALLPLFFSAKFIADAISSASKASAGVITKLLPHLGSTVIIGITVYVFRLLILLFMGKQGAGDLYTAFAIGGLTGSVFANALGASIVLHEQRIGKRYFPPLLHQVLAFSFALGLLIFASAVLQLPVLTWSGKSYFFWEATGLSLIGGAIMVYAQRVRFRILQNDEEKDVFGPDVMMNVSLLATVPFAYYLFGPKSMTALYLLSAVLAYVFYSSSRGEGVLKRLSKHAQQKIKMGIAIALLFPIFFQVSHGIFNDPSFLFNSGGKLANLPIPLSVVACYVGIVLIGSYRRAFISYVAIFLTCVLMVMATVVSTSGNLDYQQAKLVLLLQFILPMFALALGQAYSSAGSIDNSNSMEKSFLYVLIIIVPLQLIASWHQGFSFLVPSVWLFSIYQQLQYVPVIFVSAYLIAFFSLWHMPPWRPVLLVLAPIMAIYVAASISMLAIGLLLIGFFALCLFLREPKKTKWPVITFLLAVILSWGYLQHEMDDASWKFSTANDGSEMVPRNVSSRIDYWKHYLNGVTSSPRAFLIGQELAPDRTKYPSAHNYYLDFIYNFGLLALLPILTLLGITCALIYKHRRKIRSTSDFTGLCMIVLFLLLVDNSLKVGLRQPYPGIFTFFLWGILLNRLLLLNTGTKSNAD